MQERFETFTVLIAKINRNIRKIKSFEMAEFELKAPHVSCLYYLYREGGLTAKELADRCDEDKAAISRSIDYLEERGYLTCNSSAKKRYKAPLALTDSGLEVAERISEKIDGILNIVGKGQDEEERHAFYRSLKTVSDNLEKIIEEYE